MARTLELVAEFAVVEDATHVGADRRQPLDLIPFADQKTLDRAQPKGDRRALRQISQRLDPLPGALVNQRLARPGRRRPRQPVEPNGRGDASREPGGGGQQQGPTARSARRLWLRRLL